MKDKVFLLGVGAQKSASSWLRNQLNSNENFYFGFMKEYHIWDVLYIDQCKKYQPTPLAMLADPRQALRLLLINFPSLYFWYFRQILRFVDVTGDFTPSYAGLDRAVLSLIRDGFSRLGIRVKVIFVMRDPVERCKSAFAMEVRDGRVQIDSREHSKDQVFRDRFMSEEYIMRTNYIATIVNLRAIFTQHDLFIELYEKLFSEEVLDDLSHFCGFGELVFDPNKFINSSSSAIRNPKIEFECYEFYQYVYQKLHNESFPIKQYWKSHSGG